MNSMDVRMSSQSLTFKNGLNSVRMHKKILNLKNAPYKRCAPKLAHSSCLGARIFREVFFFSFSDSGSVFFHYVFTVYYKMF